jgi:ABC-type amino acid transport substrate-binding protein
MPAVEPYLKSAGSARGGWRKEFECRRDRWEPLAGARAGSSLPSSPRRQSPRPTPPSRAAPTSRHSTRPRWRGSKPRCGATTTSNVISPCSLDLYEVARREQGFSPLDSARIALAAAGAARSFQPSTSRAQAEAAIPELVAYFRLLARAAPVAVDGQEAARTELAWWQARREAVPAEQYGAIIARVSTLLYGVDNGDIRRAGLLRAQAMDYRDAHSADMTEAEWAAIEDRLRSAYGLLKKAASSPAR